MELTNIDVTWLSVYFRFKVDLLLDPFRSITAFYFSFNSFTTAISLKSL